MKLEALYTVQIWKQVAPYAGAWIEMLKKDADRLDDLSLPTRERGLKLMLVILCIYYITVAPYAGAWIEI